MSEGTRFHARLMLVDDDPAQARLWERMLRRGLGKDMVIDVLTDPLAALTYAQDYSVDILVTDLSMPEICGLDLLRCVKARNKCAQVLVITANSTTAALFESIDLGAADYLLKPFQPEVLVDLVRQAVARIDRWREAVAGTYRLGLNKPAPASAS